MARGNDGQKIFLRESDYQAFTEALRTVRQRYPFSLYAYVLMSNHFHLLLEVDRFPTARILQSLLTGYVRRFNKIHGRQGANGARANAEQMREQWGANGGRLCLFDYGNSMVMPLRASSAGRRCKYQISKA